MSHVSEVTDNGQENHLIKLNLPGARQKRGDPKLQCVLQGHLQQLKQTVRRPKNVASGLL
jgi:hypothetical protein